MVLERRQREVGAAGTTKLPASHFRCARVALFALCVRQKKTKTKNTALAHAIHIIFHSDAVAQVNQPCLVESQNL